MSDEHYAHRLYVPTYNGGAVGPGADDLEEYGAPEHSIGILASDGLVLDLETFADPCNNPNLVIERRPRGWVILIAPNHGDHMVGVCIVDDPHREGDNKLYLLAERYYHNDVIQTDTPPPEIEMVPATPYAPQPPCLPFGSPPKPVPDRNHRGIRLRSPPEPL